jgi:hypothetical protein
VLAWELISRGRPFERPVALARLQGLPVHAAPSLATRWPGGSAAVIALVDRCVSIEPSRRPTARDAAAALG